MINEVAEIMQEASKAVLPMLLPKPVDISLGDIQDWQPQAFPDPMVLITSNFVEGPSGSVYFLLVTPQAGKFVDVMLGGEGQEARSMNEESVDAIKEVFNQVLGVTASNLRESKGGKFTFDQVEVHSLEAEMDLGLLLDDSDTSMIQIKLAIEGIDEMIVRCCYPVDTLESIGSIAGSEGEKKGKSSGGIEIPGMDTSGMEPPPMGDLLGDMDHPALPPEEPKATAEELLPAGANIELIMDIELPIVIRLGSTEMTLKDIMRMGPGAIIELNKSVDEPVELLVNNQTIAKGEVVVVDGNFAFRVTDIQSKKSRIESLK